MPERARAGPEAAPSSPGRPRNAAGAPRAPVPSHPQPRDDDAGAPHAPALRQTPPGSAAAGAPEQHARRREPSTSPGHEPPLRARGGPLESAEIVAFVGTTDLDRAQAFYGGALGLERTEASGFANAYAGGGATLRVTRVDRLVPAAYTVLGWRVPDVHAALGALAARGVTARRFSSLEQDADGVWTSPSGARVAWFEDPDGNLLSLTEPASDRLRP